LREKIAREFYTNAPDGLIGNEDCGQMSAWYVLNALGWYPVCPGSEGQYRDSQFSNPPGAYVWPRFDTVGVYNEAYLDATLFSPGSKLITEGKVNHIHTYDNLKHDGNLVKQSVYNKPSLRVRSNNQPSIFVANPFILSGKSLFTDSLLVEMAVANKKARIYYTINGGNERLYEKPFVVRENTSIDFYSRDYNMVSPTQNAVFTRLRRDRTVTLLNEYNPSYHAGGAQGMMDRVHGKLNWRAGDWQGYQGQDVTMLMRLEKPQVLTRVAGNFLEDQNSWIFYPKSVQFFVSTDSVQWKPLEEVVSRHSSQNLTVSTAAFESKQLPKTPVKYVKMVIKNFGPMPEWHEGRGNPTFFFVDEFEVE
jgi:hypothetical protein